MPSSNLHTFTPPREKIDLPVVINAGDAVLAGDLFVPPGAFGLVIFAHGSGSSRFSQRNRFVANVLHDYGLATLLMDLLTRDEDEVDSLTREYRFNIALLAERLVDTAAWTQRQPQLTGFPLGYFGASTGGGAALVAAAEQPDIIRAVVSRGGRPDLAGAKLAAVRAPTLLLVGERDAPVIDLNAKARAQMNAPTDLRIVPKATHLFEEPGTLAIVAEAAALWFERHLPEI